MEDEAEQTEEDVGQVSSLSGGVERLPLDLREELGQVDDVTPLGDSDPPWLISIANLLLHAVHVTLQPYLDLRLGAERSKSSLPEGRAKWQEGNVAWTCTQMRSLFGPTMEMEKVLLDGNDEVGVCRLNRLVPVIDLLVKTASTDKGDHSRWAWSTQPGPKILFRMDDMEQKMAVLDTYNQAMRLSLDLHFEDEHDEGTDPQLEELEAVCPNLKARGGLTDLGTLGGRMMRISAR